MYVYVNLYMLSAARDHKEKKTGHAVEQDRPDVLKKRLDWFNGQLDLDPERLVFIDETWTATNMARSHGRCQRASGCGWAFRMVIARPPLWSQGCASPAWSRR